MLQMICCVSKCSLPWLVHRRTVNNNNNNNNNTKTVSLEADSKGTVVSDVSTSLVLAEKISPGDRIIAIDGEDVSRMTVSEAPICNAKVVTYIHCGGVKVRLDILIR